MTSRTLTKHAQKTTAAGTRHTFTVDVPTKPTPDDFMRLVVGIDGLRQILMEVFPSRDDADSYKPKHLIPVCAKDLKPLTIYWIKWHPDCEDLTSVWYFEVGAEPGGRIWAAEWMSGAVTYEPNDCKWWCEIDGTNKEGA